METLLTRPRPSRRQNQDKLAWAAQSLRLKGLADGEDRPRCNREALYLQLLRDNQHPRMSDFILSAPLFRLEIIEQEIEEEAVSR